MKPYMKHSGVVLPLDRSNVDTDQIIPGQFLKRIERTGFGIHLFHAWRYVDGDESRPNPDFILNRKEYAGATILLTRENFGCGSSREHAPWALEDYGFRTIIAPSFADIFFNNSFKNGMLPIVLEPPVIDGLFELVKGGPGTRFEIDLEAQKIALPDGRQIPFEVDHFRKECLLNGWDDIGLTLRHEKEIDRFEEAYAKRSPFLFSGIRHDC
jgi:3-isopropylmalate/(R)-2-methylmalate dehydratase small subunit